MVGGKPISDDAKKTHLEKKKKNLLAGEREKEREGNGIMEWRKSGGKREGKRGKIC